MPSKTAWLGIAMDVAQQALMVRGDANASDMTEAVVVVRRSWCQCDSGIQKG